MGGALFALTVLVWLAYVGSRILRRSLPEFIAFLGVGVVLGPSVLGVIDEEQLANLSEVTAAALAVLMFIIGERVAPRNLRAQPWVLLAGVVQFLVTAPLVYAAAIAVDADRDVALLLAALSGAGAPLTVQALVTSARSRGRFANGLVGAHAVADALAAMTFAAVLSLIAGAGSDPVESLAGFLRLGFGWLVARLGSTAETTGENLVIVLVHVLIASAASAALDVSLPLAALTMGATAATLASGDAAQRTLVAARSVEQPLYLVFFALAGASLHLEQLTTVGAVGLAYLLARTVGKIVGGTLGGIVGRLRPRRAFHLGVDLIPQAGVAVGLAVLAAELLPEQGAIVSSVVLGSVVVFELVGPLLVARDLKSLGLTRDDEVGARGPEVIDHSIPRRVFVASAVRADVPQWVLEVCARHQGELTFAAYGDEGSDVQALRKRAQDVGVPFRWRPLTGETYSGAVIRAARETDADLVVLVMAVDVATNDRAPTVTPHERIGRHLSDVPVLIVRATTEERHRAGPLRRLLGVRLP
jgi:hypothetical protein